MKSHCDTISTAALATGSDGGGVPTDAAAPRNASSRTRSNRQRRRDKHRARLGRTGSKVGGFGGVNPPGPRVLSTAWGNSTGKFLTRGDLADLRRAIGREWTIPEPKGREFLRLVWRTLRLAGNDPRHSISIATTVVAMTASDQRRRFRALQALGKLRQAQATSTAPDALGPP